MLKYELFKEIIKDIEKVHLVAIRVLKIRIFRYSILLVFFLVINYFSFELNYRLATEEITGINKVSPWSRRLSFFSFLDLFVCFPLVIPGSLVLVFFYSTLIESVKKFKKNKKKKFKLIFPLIGSFLILIQFLKIVNSHGFVSVVVVLFSSLYYFFISNYIFDLISLKVTHGNNGLVLSNDIIDRHKYENDMIDFFRFPMLFIMFLLMIILPHNMNLRAISMSSEVVEKIRSSICSDIDPIRIVINGKSLKFSWMLDDDGVFYKIREKLGTNAYRIVSINKSMVQEVEHLNSNNIEKEKLLDFKKCEPKVPLKLFDL